MPQQDFSCHAVRHLAQLSAGCTRLSHHEACLLQVNSALTSSQEDAQSFQQQLQTQSAGATAAKQQSQQLRQQLADALAEKEGLKQQVAHLQVRSPVFAHPLSCHLLIRCHLKHL